jgi:hypothetical protein
LGVSGTRTTEIFVASSMIWSRSVSDAVAFDLLVLKYFNLVLVGLSLLEEFDEEIKKRNDNAIREIINSFLEFKEVKPLDCGFLLECIFLIP